MNKLVEAAQAVLKWFMKETKDGIVPRHSAVPNEYLYALEAAVADHFVDANKMVYKPMTHAEKMELYRRNMFRSDSQTAVVDATEAAVIARLGLEVGK